MGRNAGGHTTVEAEEMVFLQRRRGRWHECCASATMFQRNKLEGDAAPKKLWVLMEVGFKGSGDAWVMRARACVGAVGGWDCTRHKGETSENCRVKGKVASEVCRGDD